MKNGTITLTGDIGKQIKAIKLQRRINLSDPDAPEITQWKNAMVGKFYRPIKKQITIRIDADILEWFKHAGEKYQSLINQACREYMEHHSNDQKTK